MRGLRRVGLTFGAALTATLALLACESGSTSSSAAPGTDAASGVDASVPEASTGDTSAPPQDAAPDVADAADAADAAPVTSLPFATGLGANGVALADGMTDPHWTVKDGTGAALGSYVQTDALGYPGYWLAPSATSKFISPFVDTVDPGAGTFTYTTTFVLGAEVVLANVQLVIRYASDNAMSGISLNGQALGGVNAGGYSAFETLTVTSPFVAGTNTIAFTVTNFSGPTGFRAELDLTK